MKTKNQSINRIIYVTIFLFFIIAENYLNAQVSNTTHIRKGFTDWGFPGQVGEYVFNNTDENAGFLTNFPIEKMEQEIPEDILNNSEIEYYVYTSVEDAELAVVERFDMSNIGMYNMIDSMLPNGPIGDNCWHQLMMGAIRFIRNNVFVTIYSPSLPSAEYPKVEWIARKIDSLLVKSDKVENAKLINAPEIQSIEITSDLPKS